MVSFRGLFFTAVLSFALSACSLYQSDGRKFLEKSGVTYATSAQVNFVGCKSEAMSPEWLKVSQTSEAEVFASDSEDFALKVAPFHFKEPFNCEYKFNSAQEMIERTDSAVEITLFELGLSLGEFAFRPISHLK